MQVFHNSPSLDDDNNQIFQLYILASFIYIPIRFLGFQEEFPFTGYEVNRPLQMRTKNSPVSIAHF